MVAAMNDNDSGNADPGRLGPAGWITLAAILFFFLWALWYAVHSWNALDGIAISTTGWVFIVVGIAFTLAVGAGLMALVFYSARHDMDR